MRNLFFLFICSLFLSSLLTNSSAKTISGKVLSIHDGDTLSFLPSGEFKKTKLRLLGVDTPEIDFNGASQGELADMAHSFLKKLVPINSTIQVLLSDKDSDSNGRMLGQVFYQGIDINLEILKAGWGATYFIAPYDKKIVVSYQSASQRASDERLGIFSEKYKTEPLAYLFRQMIKRVDGTNIVGDFESKKLFANDSIDSVPHFRRVFFTSEESAISRGFSW